MRKLLLFFIIVGSNAVSRAQSTSWASAVCFSVNGNQQLYNTRNTNSNDAIGSITFSDSLGVFGKNSGNLVIHGAAVNITATEPVCTVTLMYTFYKDGARPASPVFTPIPLSFYCRCNGSSFAGCGGSSCDHLNDVKYQETSRSADLTQLETGNYMLEFFYAVTGGSTCSNSYPDDNNGNHYKTAFTITAPLALNLLAFNGVTRDEDIQVKWMVEDDRDIQYYELEKSVNGLNFSAIRQVSSLGGNKSAYQLTDPAPVIGTNYYRIKSYHINGTVNLSRVFRIYYGKVGNTVLIYPNPCSGNQLTIRLAAVKKGNYKLSVLGTNGQMYISRNLLHDGMDKTIQLTLPAGMNRGLYRLFLIDKVQFYKQSFLVK